MIGCFEEIGCFEDTGCFKETGCLVCSTTSSSSENEEDADELDSLDTAILFLTTTPVFGLRIPPAGLVTTAETKPTSSSIANQLKCAICSA